MTNTQTIKTTLKSAVALLNNEEATLEAQLLLQHVLNVNRAWLITHENDTLEPNQQATFEALIQRRLTGELLAYILGKRGFYGLDLMVTPDTLIPRPNTETLVDAALEKIPAPNTPLSSSSRTRGSIGFLNVEVPKMDPRVREDDDGQSSESSESNYSILDFNVLDLGTGTGAIALAIAHNRPLANVTAVDFSKSALKIAQQNAENLKLTNVSFTHSDWFSTLKGQKFDVIVSNPPYIESSDPHLTALNHEPISALTSGVDGLDDIRKIINSALIYLKPQGWLMLEHGYNQAEQVRDLLAENGLTDITTIKDFGGNDRVTIGKNPLIINTHWD